jgi:hypothetical protein
MAILLSFVLALFTVRMACGGEIVIPSTVLERDAPVNALYRTNPLATGKGSLTIEWRDVHGRLVDSRKIDVQLNDETDIGFVLDLRRAVAMQNEVHAHFSFDGVNKKAMKDHRDEDAKISFIARPPMHSWWDYNVVMWQRHSPEMFAALKTLGINGGEQVGRVYTPPDFLLKNDLRWYVENIATDFYSAYHRYYPDRNNGWEFLLAKELYQKDPSSKEAFKRHPSFSDASWLKKIHDRCIESARFFSPYNPIFYSLGDETGIAELASFWDFDFSDESLVPMRAWLKEHYGTLGALNRQWGSGFTTWNSVMPPTTNEAMKRSDDNFSSWADFKEWMDISYASALKMGTDAIHSVDPEAYVGIGGGQMPGWGGYDYSRMTDALTAIEPYDIGNNIEIIRSLNPKMAVMTTSFATGPWEKHRVWYELLHGNRGLLIWDEKSEYVSKDGAVGARGRETEPYYNEIRNGLGALLINSTRQADRIAIHYSQPSLRTEWMLDHRPKGEEWIKRFSWNEYRDSDFLRLRASYCKLIEDAGLQYNFVSYGQVERGELMRGGYRVLILPHSSAISQDEAREIHAFVEQGGTLIADGDPAAFDERSRRLPQSQLADLVGGTHTAAITEKVFGRGKAIYLTANVLDYGRERVLGKQSAVRDPFMRILSDAGVRPAFAVADEDGRTAAGVETHIFRNGDVTIVSLLSNPELQISDIGPPEFKSNEHFARSRMLKLNLPADLHVYDVRGAKDLGRRRQIPVQLNPYEPAIFAVATEAIPELRISAPARVARGETGQIGCALGGFTPAQTHVLHVEITDPSGKPVTYYSGNVLAQRGRAVWRLPVAMSDPAGKWNVRVKDLLTGQTHSATIEVF